MSEQGLESYLYLETSYTWLVAPAAPEEVQKC